MRAMVLDAPARLGGCAAAAGAGPGQVLVRSPPAPSAAPTCTSSTASCRTRSCRSSPATRSSAASSRAARASRRSRAASASACPGSAGPAARAAIAASGQENLCRTPRFTGYQIDGGYAEYTVADARYCFPVPDGYGDAEAAPLLCAGLIGHRCLRMAGDAERLGIYGFGAAAHIVAQVARHRGPAAVRLHPAGRHAGAGVRAGARLRVGRRRDELPPEELDAAIIFAPVGALVPAALRAIRPGGIVVCGGIHMSDIPSFPYDLLWGERIVSVANLTRRDGLDFLALAPKVPVRTEIEVLPLAEANEALRRLRAGELTGAAVLVP